MMHPRQAVERTLGSRLPQKVWDYLERRGFVEDAEANFDALIDEARTLLDLGSLDPREPLLTRRRGRNTSAHVWAVSRWFLHAADEEPSVRNFRDRVLHDELLDWSDVESWLVGRGSETPMRFALVELGPDMQVETTDGMLTCGGPQGLRVRQLSSEQVTFAMPGDTWVRRIPVSSTEHDHLRRVAEELVRHYPWQRAQATIYVLTGVTPLVSQIRVTRGTVPISNRIALDAARRITLEVDPTMPVSAVVRAYRDACREIGLGSFRALSEKHAELAAFVIDAAPDTTWSAQLATWNARFPQWRYEHASNFRRDARRAEARLAYPGGYPGDTPLRTSRAE